MLNKENGKLVDLPINEIIPYFRNPRNNAAAVPYVRESIRLYGYNQYIVVDDMNVIIVGHTRHLALKELDYKTVTVLRVNLPQALANQYRLVDNKVAEYATFDPELLRAELGDMSLPDIQPFFNFDLEAFVAENAAAADSLLLDSGTGR